jgi:uncharacterized protein YoxC
VTAVLDIAVLIIALAFLMLMAVGSYAILQTVKQSKDFPTNKKGNHE